MDHLVFQQELVISVIEGDIGRRTLNYSNLGVLISSHNINFCFHPTLNFYYCLINRLHSRNIIQGEMNVSGCYFYKFLGFSGLY